MIQIRIPNTDPDPGEPSQCGSMWIRIRNNSFVSSADNWANHALAHNFEETGRALQVLQIIVFRNYESILYILEYYFYIAHLYWYRKYHIGNLL
jgi:hypothetical protein